jgi:hypothetical protein
MPLACSALALAISATISDTFLIDSTISVSRAPAAVI